MGGQTLYELVEEPAYQKKIDVLEKQFGRKDQLKNAICHALQRAAFNEKEYAERMRLPLSISDLRLLPFNQNRLHPEFPIIYVLNEVRHNGGKVILVDIIGPYY